MPEEKPEQKFTIVFKRSPDYKIYSGPTLYGGPTPDGQGVLINFCVDHLAFPSYVEHRIRPDGTVDISEITNIAQVGNVEREIQAGLYLSVSDAIKTIAWLQKMLDQMKGGHHE